MVEVSVIIPNYNCGNFLKESIQSVLDQSFDNLELIVVDDGSTDNSMEIISNFKDPRIVSHFQANHGLSNARNQGISYSRGNYLAFLDADDMWLPNKLEKQLDLIKSNPKIGLVYGGYYVIDIEGKILAKREPKFVKSDWYENLLLGNYVSGSASNALIRKECLEITGWFDETLPSAEDRDLWLRIAKYYELHVVNEPTAYIRVRENQMTSKPILMSQGLKKVINKNFRDPKLGKSLSLILKCKVRSRMNATVANFALSANYFFLTIRFALLAIFFNPFNLDGYYLIYKLICKTLSE